MGKKLLRESNVKFIQHIVRGLQNSKPEYQEKCIAWVRELNGYAACLQETWMLGDTDEELHKYVILNHGPPAKLCKRGSLGVAIMLFPPALQAWVRAGNVRQHFGLRIIAVRLHAH